MRTGAKELRILYTIADELNGATDVGRALTRMLEIVTAMLGLRTGWIWLIDPETNRFYNAASTNLPPYLREPVHMAGTWCQCTQQLREGKLSAHNIDVIECSRLASAVEGKLEALTGGLRYHASVPLYFRGKKLGIMNLTGPKWRRLSAAELQLLTTIALQAAAMIERARLADQGARLARVEERTRLAREIHDTLTQRMTAIALQLEGALKHFDREDTRARVELRRALDMSRDGITEARNSVLALRGTPLAGKPMPQAIEALARSFTSRTGIQVQVDATPVALSPRMETELLAIVKEALTNVEKHAQATNVTVQIRRTRQRVNMMIQDNGAGYAKHQVGGGQGVIGMRERAKLMGGSLTIGSAHPRRRKHGTKISLTAPLQSVT